MNGKAAGQGAISQGDQRFRDLIEGLSTVVWEADARTFQCSYASPQAEAMFGYPLDDWMLPDFWQRAIHPDDFEYVVDACHHAVDREQDHVLEYRMIRADGAEVWVRDFVRCVTGENGKLQQLRGVITDITTSRQAAEAITSSEKRYHSLFDRLPVGLYRTTPDGVLNDANPALATLLGFHSRDALLASNTNDFHVDLEDRRRWQRLLDNAVGVVEVDRRLRRADEAIVWVRDTARAVRDENGAVVYYEGALQEVTERVRAEEALRRSEARFRSLIENASDGVIILTRDGAIKYQTPAVQRILGYPPEELLGTHPFDKIHPDDLHALTAAFTELRDRPGHSRTIEFSCRHADGSWRVLHVVGTNLLDDAAVGGYVVNMIDTTLHRQLASELQHAQKMEAVGRLAGGIAHDFNNLLTAIQGYTDLLGDKASDDARTVSDLGEIRLAVERAARLTRQLLAFSRKQVVRPRATDVGRVLTELEPMLKRLAEDVTLSVEVSDDCWVHADPGQLEQCVVNMVVNARDAQPVTTVTISVGQVIDPDVPGLDAGGYIALIVTDDGCGMEPEVLAHIFEPFFSTRGVGKGTGLGLATVYGIVQECGGRIFADSTPSVGTRMSIYLPCIATPVAVDTGSGNTPSGDELILLVEDEVAVRALAERVLRRQGYQVMTAENGIRALETARAWTGRIDLLITDVVMPEMGGVQLARHLLRERPDLGVLFISGYAADALPATDPSGRPLHFLEKPFSPATFASAVRAALDQANQRT